MSSLTDLPAWVQERLHDAGDLADRLEVPVYLVGGIVRDVFLDQVRADIDLAVVGDGIRFAERLAREHQGRITAHSRFGTATIEFPDRTKLDIVTARSERYEKPGALPRISPDTLDADLARRDFTINAMAICLNAPQRGLIIDPYNGRRDLDERLIRVLHDRSFIDDPTRMFRAVRFEQRLHFRLEADTEQACRHAVESRRMDYLSARRLLEQIRLSCEEEAVWPNFRRFHELGVWQALHPALGIFDGLERMVQAIDAYKNTSDQSTRNVWRLYLLALLSACDADALSALTDRMKPDRNLKAALMDLPALKEVAQKIKKQDIDKPGDFYKAVRNRSEETVLLLAVADPSEAVREYARTYYEKHRRMHPAIDGRVLQEFGIREGPVYGWILEQVLIKKINGEIHDEEDERRAALEIWNDGKLDH